MHDHKEQAIVLVMLETIDKIQRYTANIGSCDAFEQDTKSFDATVMNFIVLGELAGKLSEHFKESYPDIDWRKIYAFRNVLAHDYFGIYPVEVWEIVQKHLPILKSQLESISSG